MFKRFILRALWAICNRPGVRSYNDYCHDTRTIFIGDKYTITHTDHHIIFTAPNGRWVAEV